ncbi:putative periplasmic protein [Hydrogenimonas sp.]|nr:putative periplasmic protein [Hydrogenimonas sp.]
MRKLLTIFTLVSTLTAQIQLTSPIPLPSTVIIDLDPHEYSDEELMDLVQKGQIFTFLAKAKNPQIPELAALKQNYMTLFNITHKIYSSAAFKVAFIVPYKIIGKYAYSTSNSALAYLLNRKIPFEMELYPIQNEDNATLHDALQNVSGGAYDLVVAPVTMKGAEYICGQRLDTELFIPTLHKNRIECMNNMVSFGGIDYNAQIETLSYLVEHNATTITVSDSSPISKMLSDSVADIIDVKEQLSLNRSGYYKDMIEKHEDLNQSTIFLNTPVVKSSLFLSQLTLADFKPEQVLSTQINYSPLLLTLTQYHDRENMVVASSIGDLDPVVSENIALINQDVRFNWLNYATVSGLDYYFSAKTGEQRLSKEIFSDGSIDYSVKLYEAGLYRFVPKEIPQPPEDMNDTYIYDEYGDGEEPPQDIYHSDMME